MNQRRRIPIRKYRGTDYVVTKLVRTPDDPNPFFFCSIDGEPVTDLHDTEEAALLEFKAAIDELFDQVSPDPTKDLHLGGNSVNQKNLH